MRDRRSAGWERSLVDRLVADARPVRRLWQPEVRWAAWLAVSALIIGLPALGVLRVDLPLRAKAPAFLLEQGLMLLGAILLAHEAMHAAVPGRHVGRGLEIAGWVALGLGVALMLAEPVHTGWTSETFLELGRHCVWRALIWGAIPWAVFLLALRRGAPFARRHAGALAGAATFGLSCAAIRVCCQTDEVLHLGAFHILPLVGGILVSAAVAPLLIRDRGRS
jgi:hypothetical protein